MKIAVNTRLLIYNKLEGIGRFSYEILKRLTQNHPEHHFYFIFDRPFHSSFIFGKNITPIVLSPPTRHPILWYYWLEHKIPSLIQKINADLFFSPDVFISLKSPCPSIPVIHDINFEQYPQFTPRLTSAYYRYFFPKYAHKAKHIFTVSQFSKQAIIELYHIPENKITVAYNGLPKVFSETITSNTSPKNTSEPYFLFVGALSPRKNVANLLRAFDIFKQQDKQNFKLLIVGNKMHLTKEIAHTYSKMQYKNDVIFKGRVEDKLLVDIYRQAFALVFIPLYEGFGIPLLEAMATQIPIIASNTSSLPEIAKKAALYVSPSNTISIAEAMQQLAKNKLKCKQMVEYGNQRLNDFSWDKSAEIIWEVLQLGARLQVAPPIASTLKTG